MPFPVVAGHTGVKGTTMTAAYPYTRPPKHPEVFARVEAKLKEQFDDLKGQFDKLLKEQSGKWGQPAMGQFAGWDEQQTFDGWKFSPPQIETFLREYDEAVAAKVRATEPTREEIEAALKPTRPELESRAYLKNVDGFLYPRNAGEVADWLRWAGKRHRANLPKLQAIIRDAIRWIDFYIPENAIVKPAEPGSLADAEWTIRALVAEIRTAGESHDVQLVKPAPAAGGEKPATGETRTVESRMMEIYTRDGRCIDWTAKEWAAKLECDPSSVKKTVTWKRCMADRAERKEGRRGSLNTG